MKPVETQGPPSGLSVVQGVQLGEFASLTFSLSENKFLPLSGTQQLGLGSEGVGLDNS